MGCGSLWDPHPKRRGKEQYMIDLFGSLWSILTTFFSMELIYNPLFMGLILFNLIFFVVYCLMAMFDPANWDVRF